MWCKCPWVLCSTASLNDAQFCKTKTNCCNTSLTYRMTCTVFSCAYFSKPRHECKFQMKSTCLLVISEWFPKSCQIAQCFWSGTEPHPRRQYSAKQQEPCEHRLVSPSRHGYLPLLSLMFYTGVWCISFVRFFSVKFSNGRLVVRLVYIDSDRALTDRQTQLKLHLLTASRK
jgi:hypothetical protein